MTFSFSISSDTFQCIVGRDAQSERVNASDRPADTGSPVISSTNRWPVPARTSSIQSTCHSCQRRDTEKWIPERRCILTVTVAILRRAAAYLQRAAPISAARGKERRPETRLRQKSIFRPHPRPDHDIWSECLLQQLLKKNRRGQTKIASIFDSGSVYKWTLRCFTEQRRSRWGGQTVQAGRFLFSLSWTGLGGCLGLWRLHNFTQTTSWKLRVL